MTISKEVTGIYYTYTCKECGKTIKVNKDDVKWNGLGLGSTDCPTCKARNILVDVSNDVVIHNEY